jgi:hypothetical protein
MKEEIELKTKSQNENIRDFRVIRWFKKHYQPRKKLVKEEYSGLFADSHRIFKQMEELVLLDIVYTWR